MGNGILSNWTVTRALYLIMGLFVVVQAVYEKQYFGIAIGGYFMAMAIFNFGCAAGGCCNTYMPDSTAKARETVNTTPIEFEEIKSK